MRGVDWHGRGHRACAINKPRVYESTMIRLKNVHVEFVKDEIANCIVVRLNPCLVILNRNLTVLDFHLSVIVRDCINYLYERIIVYERFHWPCSVVSPNQEIRSSSQFLYSIRMTNWPILLFKTCNDSKHLVLFLNELPVLVKYGSGPCLIHFEATLWAV